MRAAAGGPQGLRAPDVSRDKRHLFRRIWPRWLTDAVTAPGIETMWWTENYKNDVDSIDRHIPRTLLSCVCSGCSNIPQRPPFQCAVIDHVGSLQDRIRRWGQTHAGCGRDSQPGSRWSEPEPVQALPDRVILYEQLQRVTGAVNKIVHLNKPKH